VRLCRAAQLCAHEVSTTGYMLLETSRWPGGHSARSVRPLRKGLVEQVRDTDGRFLPRNAKAVWKVSEKGKCLSEEEGLA
jgi:hypothetical protein